jgi:hypothetical protein
LRPFEPYIFHANFVVGLRKKLLITKIAHKQHGLKLNGIGGFASTILNLELFAFRSLYFLRRILKSR